MDNPIIDGPTTYNAGRVIRCETSGCYQQIEKLSDESLQKWVARREAFRRRHQHPFAERERRKEEPSDR